MIRRHVGDVETLHHLRRAGESENFSQLDNVLERFDRAGQSSASGELARGIQGQLQVLNHVAQQRGLLKIHDPGSPFHFFAQFVEHLPPAFSLEQAAHLFDPCMVFVARDPGDAGCGAIADDVGIAVFVLLFAGFVGAAHPQSEFPVQPFDRCPKRAGMGKGSEVARMVVFFQTRHHQPRPGVVRIDLHQIKALVVAKADIVAGTVVLDEFALQQQGLLLVADDMKLKVPDGVDQGAGFDIGTHFSRWHEIPGHSFAQIFRLSDIDDRSDAVLHQIDPGLMGHLTQFYSEIRLLHHRSSSIVAVLPADLTANLENHKLIPAPEPGDARSGIALAQIRDTILRDDEQPPFFHSPHSSGNDQHGSGR